MIWERLVYSRRERIELYHALATLVGSDVQLPDALEAVGRQEAEHRGAAGRIRQAALAGCARTVRAGRAEAAFEALAPSDERVLLGYLGEVPGDAAFTAAARVAELGAEIRAAALRALGEPTLYALAVVAMLWMAGGYFLAPFAEIAPIETWSNLSQRLGRISFAIHGNTLLVASSTATVIAVVGASVTWWTGAGRDQLDRIPPWSLYGLTQGAAFVLALRALAGMGIAPSPDTFARLRTHASPWLRAKIRELERRMEGGAGFGVALAASGGFPNPKIATVAGALAGNRNFDEAFAHAADRWLGRIAVDVRAAAMLLQYFFISILGVVLLGMMKVMFELYTVVG